MSRLVDLCVGSVLLVLTAPLQLAIAVAVWLDAGRPVLFAQTRPGRGGAPFVLHKFRTLPAGDPGPKAAAVARGTPLGRWLRRWHLDELPQLFDVLAGPMALVGPRPEVPADLEAIDAGALARLWRVRPGLTGPTQLAFLAEDELLAEHPDPERSYRCVLVPAKVSHDLAWLERRTWWSDLWVLLRTPFVLVSGVGRRRSLRRVQQLLDRARPSARQTEAGLGAQRVEGGRGEA